MSELARHIKAELPEGFRAYLGSGLAVATDAPKIGQPDVAVRAIPSQFPAGDSPEEDPATPDIEIAVATLEVEPSLLIEREGRLVAALELISPRNKDRPSSKTKYGVRYASYLMEGINLVLIDVQPRPAEFSFAQFISKELEIPDQPPLPPPMAITYRVGEPAPDGGRFLAIWRYPLSIGNKLPNVVLPLDVNLSVSVDLENTYMRAAKDAYLA